MAVVIELGQFTFSCGAKGRGFLHRSHAVTLVVPQKPELMVLSNDKAENLVQPPGLVFGPPLLILWIPERDCVDVGNMGIQPRVTSESTKNSHPADTFLALGDFAEGT
jgi:hypothetical protein